MDVSIVGRALRGVRAGTGKIAVNQPALARASDVIRVESPAFGPGQDIPARFTVDGPGLSPPLSWSGVPDGTRSLLLLIEDPDAPLPLPLNHGLFFGLPPGLTVLPEGALPLRLRGTTPEGIRSGRNGYARTGWIPPTPPPGHGPHHYAFQIFALSREPRFPWPPSRWFALKAIARDVIGRGALFGTYER